MLENQQNVRIQSDETVCDLLPDCESLHRLRKTRTNVCATICAVIPVDKRNVGFCRDLK